MSLIILDINSNHIEAYSKVLKLIADNQNTTEPSMHLNSSPLLISHWIYFLMPKYVLHDNIETTIRSTKSPINFSKIPENDLIKNIKEKQIIVVEDDRRGDLVSKNVSLNLVYKEISNPYVKRFNLKQYPYTALQKKYNFGLGTRITIKTNK